MLRTAVVDDHKLFRKGLSRLISGFDGVEVVLEAENGRDLLEQLKAVTIDFLLIDLQMPELDGFETCRIVRSRYPLVKIIVISQLASKEAIHRIMELDLHGYFSKNSDPEQLKEAFKSIMEKDFYFGNELGNIIKQALLWERNKGINKNNNSTKLSDREIQIVKLACQEYSSFEIAEKLFLSTRTVEAHRKKIMEKTDSRNFIGVALFALKNELFNINDL